MSDKYYNELASSLVNDPKVKTEKEVIEEYREQYPVIGGDLMHEGMDVITKYWHTLVERELLAYDDAPLPLIEKAKAAVSEKIKLECLKASNDEWDCRVDNVAKKKDVSDLLTSVHNRFGLKYRVSTSISKNMITAYVNGSSMSLDSIKWVLWSSKPMELPEGCSAFASEFFEQIPHTEEVKQSFSKKMMDYMIVHFTKMGEREVTMGYNWGKEEGSLDRMLYDSLVETGTIEPDVKEYSGIARGLSIVINSDIIKGYLYPSKPNGSIDLDNVKRWVVWRKVSQETVKNNIHRTIDWWVDQLNLEGEAAHAYSSMMLTCLTEMIIERGETCVHLSTDYGPEGILSEIHDKTRKSLGGKFTVPSSYPFKFSMAVGDEGVFIGKKEISELKKRKQPTVLDEYSGFILQTKTLYGIYHAENKRPSH
jgi:hypothetical protein